MTPRERQLAANTLAPTLLLIAVGTMIASQLGAPLPLAGAAALAAWGTSLALPPRKELAIVTLVVYAPLIALAVAAQLDAASGAGHGREFVAALDSGAAVGLLILLIRRTSSI